MRCEYICTIRSEKESIDLSYFSSIPFIPTKDMTIFISSDDYYYAYCFWHDATQLLKIYISTDDDIDENDYVSIQADATFAHNTEYMLKKGWKLTD
jgi:hypothetical protein